MLRSALALLLLCATPAWAANDFRQPEAATAVQGEPRTAVSGTRYMVAAANPLAVEAGAKVLAEGGNAVDAAIATQLVLNVVEPQSSGIGGGGFMLYFDAGSKTLHAYDGRETAPISVDDTLFLDEDGKPLPFMEAVQGGHSVGTPGLLKMLEHAHRKHGHTEWPRLFADALRLSGTGFAMSPRLHELLSTTAHVQAFPSSMRPFVDAEGNVKPVGATVINTALHDTFAVLSLKGTQPFYAGTLGRDIVQAVQKSPIHPGTLTMRDLQQYTVKEREPVCAPYRQYRICSMPPPSSGGITILQALGILERIGGMDVRKAEPVSVDAVHMLAEASKLAYADRNRYLADPDFVAIPTDAMLDADYLAKRAGLIAPDKALQNVPHGVFGEEEAEAAFLLTTEEHPSTTHISIIDRQGNAVAMTTSIEQGFGSGLSAGGFLLNNQLTDFSFSPTLPDGVTPHPNRVEPGKRPRSSMSPTMVFDENGKLVMVIGSPGGARIIAYVLQSLIAVLDWKLDIQQAINLPHYLNMNGPTELEAGTSATALKAGLESRGHTVRIHDTNSGLHAITHMDGQLEGGADPRREGIAIGQ